MKTTQAREETMESDKIKSEISETRRKMDETIDRLGQRLQPRHLVDDIMGYIKSHVADRDKVGRTFRRAGQQTIRVVTENPVPVFLISVGIVWILVEHEKSGARSRRIHGGAEMAPPRAESYPPGGPDLIEETFEKVVARHGKKSVGMITSTVETRSQVSNLARSAKEETMSGMQSSEDEKSQAGQRAGERWRQRREFRRERFRHASEGYPLAMGFGFLALGMLAGLALGRREEEDRYYGETSPGLLQRTKEKAGEWVEKGKQAVENVAEGVKKEAEKHGLTPDQMKEKARRAEESMKPKASSTGQKEGEPRPPNAPQQVG